MLMLMRLQQISIDRMLQVNQLSDTSFNASSCLTFEDDWLETVVDDIVDGIDMDIDMGEEFNDVESSDDDSLLSDQPPPPPPVRLQGKKVQH